ncbi:MAG: UDP-N-acetylmuramate dehydrogenase [Proteobacteria bacterium]|nr:UDP-N-acetylmuramate dehydrogenase [Pseudomonadota bacterium]
MPLTDATRSALAAADVPFDEDVPLASRAWWRVGGPADALVTASTLEHLIAVQRIAAETETPVFVLGNGSNLLVSDAGVRGMVVLLRGELAKCTPLDDAASRIEVGGGFKLTVLVSRSHRNGWTGLEVFAGIPGTIGGAIRMNAGAGLGETVDALVSAEAVLPGGTVRTFTVDELKMSYRTCELPAGAIVARAILATRGGDPDVFRERVRSFLERRKASQPLKHPSCGSTFRNPPGDYAGRLIEAAGLKGFQIGAAQVAHKHANFVLNLGGATASDLRRVVEHVQNTVQEQFGVKLEREVHYAGDWSDWS